VFNWEIAPGKTIEAWGFNKQLPGPMLEANVGDTLVVRVTNNLGEATIVHWHGIRIPAAMDGTGMVQKPIEPGKLLNIVLLFLMPELSGITLTTMKRYKWKEECTVLL